MTDNIVDYRQINMWLQMASEISSEITKQSN